MDSSKDDLDDPCIIKAISACYEDVDAEVLQYGGGDDNGFVEVKRC